MNSSLPDSPASPPPFDQLLTAISDRTRWRALDELLKGEALPVGELSRRLGVHPSTMSKHMAVLRDSGVVTVGYGRVYRIPPAFLLPDQPRAVNLGAVILRLDQRGEA